MIFVKKNWTKYDKLNFVLQWGFVNINKNCENPFSLYLRNIQIVFDILNTPSIIVTKIIVSTISGGIT